MSAKMQHCFYCGAEIGFYEMPRGTKDTCGEQECDRGARDAELGELEDAQYRAQQDDYERYR